MISDVPQTHAQNSWVTFLPRLWRALIRACERQPRNMSMRSHRAGVSRDAALEKSSGLGSALDGACQRLNRSSHVAAGVVARIASDSSIVRRLPGRSRFCELRL